MSSTLQVGASLRSPLAIRGGESPTAQPPAPPAQPPAPPHRELLTMMTYDTCFFV